MSRHPIVQTFACLTACLLLGGLSGCAASPTPPSEAPVPAVAAPTSPALPLDPKV